MYENNLQIQNNKYQKKTVPKKLFFSYANMNKFYGNYQ